MSYVKRIIKPEDVVTPGETVSVLVKEIDAGGRRISLSIRDAEGDPWIEVSDKFSVGQVVTGTLEKKEKFGYFVTLAPGITGLLPKSKITGIAKPTAIEQLKIGDLLAVTVAEIHPLERKITLTPGGSKGEADWKDFTPAATRAPMSDLAEKLLRAMSSKNSK
jgi:small subunit ribosomal protein S1